MYSVISLNHERNTDISECLHTIDAAQKNQPATDVNHAGRASLTTGLIAIAEFANDHLFYPPVIRVIPTQTFSQARVIATLSDAAEQESGFPASPHRQFTTYPFDLKNQTSSRRCPFFSRNCHHHPTIILPNGPPLALKIVRTARWSEILFAGPVFTTTDDCQPHNSPA